MSALTLEEHMLAITGLLQDKFNDYDYKSSYEKIKDFNDIKPSYEEIYEYIIEQFESESRY